MSIAVCVVVRPSAWLRLLFAVFALGAGGAALALSGRLSPAGAAAPWAGGLAGAAASAAASVYFCVRFVLALHRQRYAVSLDISGVGHLRAAVYQSMGAAGLAHGTGGVADGDGGGDDEEGKLLPASTLWPGLLLLRVHSGGGARLVLPVWPDSVAAGQFRPLAASCRVIATRHAEY